MTQSVRITIGRNWITFTFFRLYICTNLLLLQHGLVVFNRTYLKMLSAKQIWANLAGRIWLFVSHCYRNWLTCNDYVFRRSERWSRSGGILQKTTADLITHGFMQYCALIDFDAIAPSSNCFVQRGALSGYAIWTQIV